MSELVSFEVSCADGTRFAGGGHLCEPSPQKFLFTSVYVMTFEVRDGATLERLRAVCRPSTDEDLAFIRRRWPDA